ncbi:mammalian cell entry protein [Rhodococcus oryzae]|uniref:mammalian cell entry protein n=1 Tax=Rhodococcus oryzae TaxID=2571143 RepID=UPI0037AE3DE5
MAGVQDADPAGAASPAVATGSRPRGALVAGTALLAVVAVLLATACGVMVWQHRSASELQSERETYLRVAREGALNLTTIDHNNAEADVQRVLDGATGEFYDDFDRRSQGFITVVRDAKVTTVGESAAAGIETEAADSATVLVQVASRVSNGTGAQDQQRVQRLRVTVDREQSKISRVEYLS